MGVPRVYRKSNDINVNYDFLDIENGLGYSIYYLNATYQGGSNKFGLLGLQVYSNGSIIGNIQDLDTSPFQIGRTINGDIYISLSNYNSTAGTLSVKVQLKKWDGTTETNITSEIISSPAGSYSPQMILIKVNVDNIKIKKREIIRLTINTQANHNYVGVDSFGDPTTLHANLKTLESKIYIPFKLNL